MVRRQLKAANAAGQFPDIAIVASVDAPQLVARDLLREMRLTFERVAGVNGDLFPPLLDLATAGPWNDNPSYQKPPIWAIPHISAGSAWLVRHDLLASKTIPPPSTIDDFRLAAEQLTDAAAGTFGWGGPLPLNDATDDLAQTILLDHGVGIFEASGLQLRLPRATPRRLDLRL